ncbi:MAG: nuclear transport factor 2 family protein [Opitutaceae bacterium]|nr:nuclear transport factor 2 family protein [Opitutaceae bacterium]
MSSSSLLNLALSYWDAEARGDLPAVLEHFDRNAAFTAPGFQLHGRQEIAAFYKKIMGTYKTMRIEARRTIEHGDDIVVEFGFHFTRQNGTPGYAEGCNVFTITQSQITRLRAYFNPSDY